MAKKTKNKPAIEESFDVLSPSNQLAPIVFASPHSGTAYPTDFIANSPLDLLALRRSEDSRSSGELAMKSVGYAVPLCGDAKTIGANWFDGERTSKLSSIAGLFLVFLAIQ
jgi:hypothetical protein